MEDKLSYIDNITGGKLKEFIITPDTSWEVMNSKLTYVAAGGAVEGFVSNIGSWFTTKSIVVSVVVLSIITAGIIFLNNDSEDDLFIKDIQAVEVNETNNQTVFNKDDNLNNVVDIAEDSLTVVNETKKTKKKSEDVVINIEIPVHKEVVIKKEIIIRDTISNKDSVKIK